MSLARGEVWWARLWPKRRPVVLLTRSETLTRRALVTVCPITSTERGLFTEVPLGPEDGLPRRCFANADDLGTIPKSLLESRICALSEQKLLMLSQKIHFALALDCPGTLGQTDIIAP